MGYLKHWCMKTDGAICVSLLPAKHMSHGSCVVGRGSIFEWISGSWVAVNNTLSVLASAVDMCLLTSDRYSLGALDCNLTAIPHSVLHHV